MGQLTSETEPENAEIAFGPICLPFLSRNVAARKHDSVKNANDLQSPAAFISSHQIL